MLRSEQQLNNDAIVPNLLEGISILDLDSRNIINQGFIGLEATPFENFGGLLSEDNDQSSVFRVQSQSTQTQSEIKELQNDTVDKTESRFKIMLQHILFIACKDCTEKFQAIYGVTIDDLRNKAQKKLGNSVHTAIKEKNLKKVEGLLRSGVDVSWKNRFGNTPLHTAIMHHDTNIIRALLRFNPNVELCNSKGQTPLQYSVDKTSIGAFRLLLDYGANPNVQDSEGNTVAHKIINAKGNIMMFCLTLLLQNKSIDLNIKNSKGESCASLMLNKFMLNGISKKKFSKYSKSVEKYKEKLRPHNVLDQPSSSGYVDEFLNITR